MDEFLMRRKGPFVAYFEAAAYDMNNLCPM